MDSGVKVVGAVPGDKDKKPTDDADATDHSDDADGADDASPDGPPPPSGPRRRGGDRPGPTKRTFRLVVGLAVLGLVGTVVFGVLYATSGGGGQVQDPAVTSAARTFLNDFFNFNAKTVDANFNAVERMATGAFSTQAQGFFNSSIRKALQQALAESRGQIRYLEVQHEGNGTASVYAVIDQTYVNNKVTTPQSDVVRLVADMQQVNGVWKISNVTTLEGATPASAGSASGSAGSTVPGQ